MEDKYIKVLVPYNGCPSGRVLYVTHFQENGTAICLNADDTNDWTTYYIYKKDYELVEGDGK